MNKAKRIYTAVKNVTITPIVHWAEIRHLSAQLLVLLRESERGFFMGTALQEGLGRPATGAPELILALALGRLETKALIVHFRTFCSIEGCYARHDIWAAADRFAYAGPAAATRARWDGHMPPLPGRAVDQDQPVG